MTRILIVDDSSAIRMAIRGILHSIGVETDEAEDGQVALDKLDGGSFDAVLLDWNMPVLNGFECLRALRADDRYGDPRVLMVTTENSFDQISLALEEGADEYVMKPFDKDIIVNKLASVGVTV